MLCLPSYWTCPTARPQSLINHNPICHQTLLKVGLYVLNRNTSPSFMLPPFHPVIKEYQNSGEMNLKNSINAICHLPITTFNYMDMLLWTQKWCIEISIGSFPRLVHGLLDDFIKFFQFLQLMTLTGTDTSLQISNLYSLSSLILR